MAVRQTSRALNLKLAASLSLRKEGEEAICKEAKSKQIILTNKFIVLQQWFLPMGPTQPLSMGCPPLEAPPMSLTSLNHPKDTERAEDTKEEGPQPLRRGVTPTTEEEEVAGITGTKKRDPIDTRMTPEAEEGGPEAEALTSDLEGDFRRPAVLVKPPFY